MAMARNEKSNRRNVAKSAAGNGGECGVAA
jgi:hypothetical protein